MSVRDVQQFIGERRQVKSRFRLMTAVKWTVSLLLLAWIVYFAKLGEVLESLRDVDLRWVLAAACLQPVGSFLTAARWRLLLISQGVQVRLWHLFRSCIAANFFKQFMPSTIGGDPVRAYDSWRAGASRSVAISTLVVDRLLGLLVLASFVVLAMALLGNTLLEFPLLPLWVGLGIAALAAAVWVVFAPPSLLRRLGGAAASRLPGPLRQISDTAVRSVAAFRGRHRTLTAALLISAMLQVNVVMFYYLISRAMGFEIPLLMFFVIVPLATFVMLLPISINGIGVREGVFIVLLGAAGLGVARAEAVAFAWLEYGIFLFHGILGGLLYAFTRSPDARSVARTRDAGPPNGRVEDELAPRGECPTVPSLSR